MCAVHVLTIQHVDFKGTPIHMYMCIFSDCKEACDTCINYIVSVACTSLTCSCMHGMYHRVVKYSSYKEEHVFELELSEPSCTIIMV